DRASQGSVHVARVLADINLPLRIDFDAIRVNMADIVGEIVEVHEYSPNRQCGAWSDLELDQPVHLGLHDIQDLAVFRDGETVGAVHVGGLLRDRGVRRHIKDLAIDHGARGSRSGEVYAAVTVRREVVRT